MVNLILKFKKNPKKPNQIVSFYKKKICLVLEGSEFDPRPNEIWECFKWADRGTFFLVKPFKKIDPKNLKEEMKRVERFNRELRQMEKMVGRDFEKVVFDADNQPYLKLRETNPAMLAKYKDFELKVVGEELWARPNFEEAQ